MIVLNPYNGSIEFAKAFDTYKSSLEFENFIKSDFGSKLSKSNLIMIIACKDDCVTNLSAKAKKWLYELGSKQISEVQYRQGYALIRNSDLSI